MPTQDSPTLDPNEFNLDSALSGTDSKIALDWGATDKVNGSPRHNQKANDLVQLYLQDIGRVPLLKKDEEVLLAQQVQRYMGLLELRTQAARKREPTIQRLVELIAVRDRLAAQLSHLPSWEEWAAVVKLEIPQLKRALEIGQRHWAQLASIEVAELEQIHKTGTRAKDMMLKANLRLVVSIAKQYQNRGLELLDLIQEGTLGLERAVEKFDPTKGYRFSTYAYWWIRQGMTRAIASQSRTIRLPIHITEKLNKIKAAQQQIFQEKGRIAKLEEIAQSLKMNPAEVRAMLTQLPRSISLEIKVGKDKDTALGDLLETDTASPEETLMRESLQQELQGLLGNLTQRERDVLQMRFGLEDGKSYSLGDIGRTLGISRERVRQIETKALEKLRQPKYQTLVRDYWEYLRELGA